jgi:hypothetical protein
LRSRVRVGAQGVSRVGTKNLRLGPVTEGLRKTFDLRNRRFWVRVPTGVVQGYKGGKPLAGCCKVSVFASCHGFTLRVLLSSTGAQLLGRPPGNFGEWPRGSVFCAPQARCSLPRDLDR